MIPQRVVANWSLAHPWPSTDQVEQDLLLAQAICEIAADDLLGKKAVGTICCERYRRAPWSRLSCRKNPVKSPIHSGRYTSWISVRQSQSRRGRDV